ncbi:MAG: SsrA-binding protein SmpB [Hyphomicrobiales bacterium]|nr:SsrA-binding protein [Rhodobiaceae bacterium]OUT82675.1 MAG: SsrA-binding protein [Rhizobiales bacterium TMED28]RZO31610.1 MAG: SsrA-binding protein SmpB [Hyphomicrobiales bacterium]|tara:strand:+ start:419 stop:883 length:465 start_codon:yes stop_codon:yes gene_type:complete
MPEKNSRIIAQNRKARFNYEIIDTMEAGIVLTGSEVKSLRMSKINITDTYAAQNNGEMQIHNLHIDGYKNASTKGQSPRRIRTLLLHKREIKKIQGYIDQKGLTIIPLKIYFNAQGRAKLEIAVARGKKHYDKREVEKKRDWDRNKQRLLKKDG